MLHGTIQVNGDSIAHWSARRLQHPPKAVNEYEVTVQVRKGNVITESAHGHLDHVYDDGPLVLANLVLAWAVRQKIGRKK